MTGSFRAGPGLFPEGGEFRKGVPRTLAHPLAHHLLGLLQSLQAGPGGPRIGIEGDGELISGWWGD